MSCTLIRIIAGDDFDVSDRPPPSLLEVA
jgi:hypothetical protein